MDEAFGSFPLVSGVSFLGRRLLGTPASVDFLFFAGSETNIIHGCLASAWKSISDLQKASASHGQFRVGQGKAGNL